MTRDYGKKYDADVLKAFDKMSDEFEKSGPSLSEEGDIPVTIEDIFGEEESGDDQPALMQEGRSAKHSKEGFLAAVSGFLSKLRENKKKNMKRRKQKKKRKIRFGRIIGALFLILLIAGIVTGFVVGKYVKGIIENTPEINPNNIYDLLAENSVMLDADGNFMENVYSGDALRMNIKYEEMPDILVKAFLAIEDKTFWDHHGFNFVRIVGAIVEHLKTGEPISGTSTITQQLARNLYLPDTRTQHTMERKIAEAYYTVILERALTKEQIMEAYLNTIALGFNSNGIAAASNAYFNKEVKDLTLVECAMLAALPKAPGTYSPMQRIAVDEVENPETLDIISKNDGWIIYYNNKGEGRQQLVLRLMHELGSISDKEYEEAKNISVRSCINPGTGMLDTAGSTSYFADFVVEQVKHDLMEELEYTEEEAEKLIYKGGLTINSTLKRDVQDIIEEEYSNTDNFPSVGSYNRDREGNILAATGKILLYDMGKMFDENEDFILRSGEYEWQPAGDLKLFGGKRLNFYRTSVGDEIDYSVEFKPMFEREEGFFYSRSGGYIRIPTEYKDRDDERDLTISKEFFDKYPDAVNEPGDGSLRLNKDYFNVADRVRQPQSAMVIMDYNSGAIVGMIGGRDIKGKRLYNRAISVRQPGSSIKPISLYATALQAGADGLGNFTAAMPLDDRPISQGGEPWPKNWYEGYTGMTNLRRAVEQSINACAVNLYMQLDPYLCVETLQKMGVSTLVTSGNVNDINASSLALGGMTKGISPLEMAAAYGTFGNYGTYREPISYTSVTNSSGDVILRKSARTTEVLDEAVSSIMLDIMRTTVTSGLASGARLKSQPVAGKTGTTSDRYDIWFCGITPKYSAACWIGNDVNISLNKGSGAAVKVWATIMERVGELDERGQFELRGDIVTATVDRYSGKPFGELSELDPRGDVGISEKFVAGTVPAESDDSHVVVTVCAETGYLATPFCHDMAHKVCIVRPGGQSWEKIIAESQFTDYNRESIEDAKYDAPDYYCPLHNPDPESYPISPIYDGTYIEHPGGPGLPGQPGEGEVPDGYWTTDPDTGLPIFVPYADGATLNPDVSDLPPDGEERPAGPENQNW